jgi:hypothetical protein
MIKLEFATANCLTLAQNSILLAGAILGSIKKSRHYNTLNGALGEIRTADIAYSYLEFFSDVWPEG